MKKIVTWIISLYVGTQIYKEMDKQGLIKYRFWDLFGEEKQDE
jgi:hypothetical protein